MKGNTYTMPKEINTSGDRGLDRELDSLWREITALKLSQSGTVKPGQFTAPPVPAIGRAGTVRVLEVDGVPDLLALGIEFDQADGFTVSDDNGIAKLNLTPAFFDFARLTSTGETLAANQKKVFQRVLDSGTARTLTLPNPAQHTRPIFIRALSAPAGGHTVARNGAETIDGVAANLTLGTVAGQLQSVLLISDGTNFYSLMRVLA